MNLKSLRIVNYRSIEDTGIIPIKQAAVVVGKNNQGKSNFIKAIEIAFEALASSSSDPKGTFGYRLRGYDYDRDFPLFNTEKKHCTISLVFSIDKVESQKLYELINTKLNDYFSVSITINENSKADVKFSKKGASGLSNQTEAMSSFILESLSFLNIHAVRTESDAMNVIDQLIQNRMQAIVGDDEYVQAMAVIKQKEKDVLSDISATTLQNLQEFLPEVNDVDIALEESRYRSIRSPYRRRFSMKINDGIMTDLDYKGDGIKSLTALALLKESKSTTQTSIIAIEEPESHLHSGAIHSLNDILRDLSSTTQVIITTHNPLFISRSSINSNIIVRDNSAFVAQNIKELRNELGVQASDNLINSELVILVEGKSDEEILKTLFEFYSTKIQKGFKNNRIVIKSVNGASKINQDLVYFKQMMCKVLVILDHDEASIKALKEAQANNYLRDDEYFVIRKKDGKECEIEDIINPSIYKDCLSEEFGLTFKNKSFRNNNKWSNRITQVFDDNCKIIDNEKLKRCKIKVVDQVKANPSEAITDHYIPKVQTIISKIENLI